MVRRFEPKHQHDAWHEKMVTWKMKNGGCSAREMQWEKGVDLRSSFWGDKNSATSWETERLNCCFSNRNGEGLEIRPF